jgi:hypothetical protein
MAEDHRAHIRSAWRPDDIVAYEEMRDLAIAAQSILISRARRDLSQTTAARAEAARLHRETLAVDGFDRKAVDAQTRLLALRLAELRTEEREHA